MLHSLRVKVQKMTKNYYSQNQIPTLETKVENKLKQQT